MLKQVLSSLSQMSFCAHNFPQGRGKCYVDDGDVARCVCVWCVCARMYNGCVLCVMHHHRIMKNRGAPCMFETAPVS